VPNTISVRSRFGLAGRELRYQESYEDQGREARFVLILVHGYQNSADGAGRSYSRLLAKLHIPPDFSVWEFHWPGDHPVKPVSVMTYSARTDRATLSGDLLAEKFVATELKRRHYVYIIAHSLGCRVALAAVKKIREQIAKDVYKGAQLRAVFLLAAAVPVRMCELNSQTPPPYDRPLDGSDEYVFYSRRDLALRFGFPLGQRAHGEWGEHGPAVGRDGHPRDGRWKERSNTRLRHGEYWASGHVAQNVSRLIGFQSIQLLETDPLPQDELAEEQLDELDTRERPLRAHRAA
jgi:pimeloyl-ACP methyl ester carboxylesterase